MTRYALGCGFNLTDMFMNFPLKKLQINCNECNALIGTYHRDKLAIRIFRECFKVVIEDIIENNVTFWLPLTGGKKCNMHMKRVEGKEFQNLRQGGKWEDIDILNSNFSGYEIRFFMLGNRTPRVKTVYLNKFYRDRISYYTNLGKSYGDSKNDKVISDYLEIVSQKFPTVSLQDIKRILSFGWKSLYLHNSYGGDTLITDKEIWCYIGRLRKNPLDHFYYYIRKLIIKIRVLYRRKEFPWNGYYYFALSEAQYQSYLSQKNKRGRPRKCFNFGTVYLYQILDECRISEHAKKYIFKVPSIVRLRLKEFRRDYTTDKAELIETRDPMKFKDILINDNKYEVL